MLQHIQQARQTIFTQANTALIDLYLYWLVGKTISHKVHSEAWGKGVIFSRCKSAEEREYYIHAVLNEKLSKRELERQINVSQFERSLMSPKLSPLARELHTRTQKEQY